MKHKLLISWAVTLSATMLVVACGGSGSNSAPVPPPSPAPTIAPPATPAHLKIYVTPDKNAQTCAYANAPCATVAVCSPGSTTQCVTISNVLVDTGSYGLRVFKNQLNGLSLNIESTNAGESIAECVSYADGSANWGPIATADINLATGVTAHSVPMQMIDASFPGVGNCSGAASNSTPAAFGINGVLGVGPLVYDKGGYYACSNNSCSRISKLDESQQVANPIALLSESSLNNGITIKMPPVGTGGEYGVIGYMVFGVGSNQDNRIESGVYVYPSNDVGIFPIGMRAVFNNKNEYSFLDTGSNGIYFDDSSIAGCGGSGIDFYCPDGLVNLSAANLSTEGYIETQFAVYDANSLFNSGNTAFSTLGGKLSFDVVDFGIPFYYGKTIYMGFESKTSDLATGPYWAFK